MIAYLHEGKQILHEIPPIPVKCDDKFTEEKACFYGSYISGILELQNLDYRELELIKQNSHFF